jgi:hypothetical protein
LSARFDNVAKALAKGVSRRRFLKLVAGGTAIAATSTSPLANQAQALTSPGIHADLVPNQMCPDLVNQSYPNQCIPFPNQSNPIPNQAGPEPVPNQSDPIPNQSDPVPNQSDPIPNQSDPVPNQSDPVPNQSDPVPNQSDPIPNQSDPEPNQGWPMIPGGGWVPGHTMPKTPQWPLLPGGMPTYQIPARPVRRGFWNIIATRRRERRS